MAQQRTQNKPEPKPDPVVTAPDAPVTPDPESPADETAEAPAPAAKATVKGFVLGDAGQEYCPACKPEGTDASSTAFTCEHGSWTQA